MSITADATAAGRMPLTAHVREARTRAVRAVVALLVGMVVGYLLSERIIDVLSAPIATIAEQRNASLNFDSVTGAFDLRLRVALFAGVVLSSPVWLREIFGFVAPGMTRREKRATIGFLTAALPLFGAGCWMGFNVFPHMVELLTAFAGDDASTVLQASSYLDFVMKVIIATGIAFVLPVFLVALNLIGVLSAATIARGWRIAIVSIVAFAALVTPAADVLSMVLIVIPMGVLYGVALGISWLHDRAVTRRQPEPKE
ncbi:MAG: twin-arginine translocase subunit TatC [Mycetocola sp.]